MHYTYIHGSDQAAVKKFRDSEVKEEDKVHRDFRGQKVTLVSLDLLDPLA